jgi:hypothetical protein
MLGWPHRADSPIDDSARREPAGGPATRNLRSGGLLLGEIPGTEGVRLGN